VISSGPSSDAKLADLQMAPSIAVCYLRALRGKIPYKRSRV
jgi:hypothetical protein